MLYKQDAAELRRLYSFESMQLLLFHKEEHEYHPVLQGDGQLKEEINRRLAAKEDELSRTHFLRREKSKAVETANRAREGITAG